MLDYFKKKANNARWWLQYRLNPKHWYHYLPTGRGPGYCDPVEQILYANMNCLKKFWNGEAQLVVWRSGEWTPKTKEGLVIADEIEAILAWWERYQEFVENGADPYLGGIERDGLSFLNLDSAYGKGLRAWSEAEDNFDEEATEMLCRMMRLRGALWT